MRGTRAFSIAVLAAGTLLPVVACTPGSSSYSGLSSPTASTHESPVTSTPSQPEIPPPPALPQRPADDTVEEIIEAAVLAQSRNHGAAITSAEWRDLRSTICKNLAEGGTGLYLSQAANALPLQDQWPVTDLYLDGAISGTCTAATKPPPPTGLSYLSDLDFGIHYRILASYRVNDIKYDELIAKYIKDVRDYGRLYDVDVSYLLDTAPEFSRSSGSSSGYNVVCADGWVSSSGGKQGACSHHGGTR